MTEFEMQVEKHNWGDWYFILGKCTGKRFGKAYDESRLMLTSGLQNDHSATVWLDVAQIDELIKHLQNAKVEMTK